MVRDKKQPPFIWGELDYLCAKVHYWLRARKQRFGAKRYMDRLEKVLHLLPDNDLAIIRAEGWALLSEFKGNIDDAVAYREREIHLIERLHKEARSPRYNAQMRARLLSRCDQKDLQERRTILEELRKQQVPHYSPLRNAQ